MFYVIVAIILLALTIGGLLFRKSNNKNYEKFWEAEKVRKEENRVYYKPPSGRDVPVQLALWPFMVAPAFLVVVTLLFSLTIVDARAVGIQTGFGRYYATLDNGLQFKEPWTGVEEFTTRLQTADLEGKEGVAVTFMGGGSGTVNATFRWSISDDQSDNGAKALWEKYKTFEEVSNTLVLREGKDAVLNVANDYTPNDARTKQDVIAAEIKKRMVEKLDEYGIIVDSVSVLSMPLDQRTQASLDKIVSSQNDVERAKADRERAKIDNETARLREEAGALDDGALVRQCLDVVNAWDVKKNGHLPATFDCNLSGTDDGNSVIVGRK